MHESPHRRHILCYHVKTLFIRSSNVRRERLESVTCTSPGCGMRLENQIFRVVFVRGKDVAQHPHDLSPRWGHRRRVLAVLACDLAALIFFRFSAAPEVEVHRKEANALRDFCVFLEKSCFASARTFARY